MIYTKEYLTKLLNTNSLVDVELKSIKTSHQLMKFVYPHLNKKKKGELKHLIHLNFNVNVGMNVRKFSGKGFKNKTKIEKIIKIENHPFIKNKKVAYFENGTYCPMQNLYQSEEF